jgi:hypothetical protein
MGRRTTRVLYESTFLLPDQRAIMAAPMFAEDFLDSWSRTAQRQRRS